MRWMISNGAKPRLSRIFSDVLLSRSARFCTHVCKATRNRSPRKMLVSFVRANWGELLNRQWRMKSSRLRPCWDRFHWFSSLWVKVGCCWRLFRVWPSCLIVGDDEEENFPMKCSWSWNDTWRAERNKSPAWLWRAKWRSWSLSRWNSQRYRADSCVESTPSIREDKPCFVSGRLEAKAASNCDLAKSICRTVLQRTNDLKRC